MRSALKLFFLFVLCSNAARSCNIADQCRLFPLGSASSGFVFVETHLYRTTDPKGNRFEMTPKWYGKSFLNTYDEKQQLISSRLLDSLSLADESTDRQFIQKSFHKGLKLAKQWPGFIAATPVYLSYCDFHQKCEEAELRQDSLKHTLFVKLRNNKEYEVTVLKDTSSIAERYLRYYSGFNGGHIDYSSIDIGSVRKYRVGAKTITLVHLANGDKPEGEFSRRREHKPDVAFSRLEKSLVYEPLLHHGHGFDFFMPE